MWIMLLTISVFAGLFLAIRPQTPPRKTATAAAADGKIVLPQPRKKGALSLEESLANRRSIRQYRNQPLTLAEVSQLLWAAQGITSAEGYRTAPSAGALYPLEIYLVAGNVEGLPAGIYHYEPQAHALTRTASGDHRESIAAAALGQDSPRGAPITIAIAAVASRTTGKYGDRGNRYVAIEVGHAAQNILLEATSLGLGAVPMGAFSDAELKRALALGQEEEPLYLISTGRT
jgi:SagB-type dehydrogenase family enzyme